MRSTAHVIDVDSGRDTSQIHFNNDFAFDRHAEVVNLHACVLGNRLQDEHLRAHAVLQDLKRARLEQRSSDASATAKMESEGNATLPRQ